MMGTMETASGNAAQWVLRGVAGLRWLLPVALVAALALAESEPGRAQAALSQSDIYCAGFFTQRPIESGLIVQGSEDGGVKNEFATGDYVYLNHGRDVITTTGTQYTLIRPVRDVNRKEAFAGQHALLAELGTYYAEVGRIEVEVLHDQSTTARIIMACDSVLAGDIAIPFSPRTVPAFREPRQTPRFAPSSGKATGLIVAAKDYDQWVGEGKIVYVNLGGAHGLQPGSYLRVVRGYLAGGNQEFGIASRRFPTAINGTQMGRKLTPAEESRLPSEVLGEVMILSVENGSATGIVTYSRTEIAVGDGVELE